MKLTTSALLAFSIAASSISITSQPSYAFDPEAATEAANPVANPIEFRENMDYIRSIGNHARERINIPNQYDLWDKIHDSAQEIAEVNSDKYHLLVADYTFSALTIDRDPDQVSLWNQIEDAARNDLGIASF
ncbi:MAG: hypothetical protein AAGA18_13990 [Verrucomicrobiota bacterium]